MRALLAGAVVMAALAGAARACARDFAPPGVRGAIEESDLCFEAGF